MIFGKSLKTIHKNFGLYVKLYFIIGGVAIFIFFIVYTNNLIQRARKDAQIAPSIFANHVRMASEKDYEDYANRMVQYIFDEIVAKIENPIIVTDLNLEPIHWKNVGVDENKRLEDLNEEEKEKLTSALKIMSKSQNKIPIESNDEGVINYAFFNESPTIRQLRIMPYLEMGFILLFVVFGVYGIIIIKRSEKNLIWVGLAKETAHQFGTPISSLIAWSDVLKNKVAELGDDGSIDELISYMKADIEQLNKVVSRFGKVGSTIELQRVRLESVIEETINYFTQRLPHLSKKIRIIFINKIKGLVVNVDPDLIKWTLENMIRNSIDSMQNKGGDIILIAIKNEKQTSILIKDEGKGIHRSMYNTIFEPGVTTKKRGWGLGLSLAKRIIEEYHKGKIRVLDSVVGDGTTFEIVLPEE